MRTTSALLLEDRRHAQASLERGTREFPESLAGATPKLVWACGTAALGCAVSLLVLLGCATVALAATPRQIIREKRVVRQLAPAAAPLKAKLAAEVAKILKAGRLAPFRTMYGEGRPHFAWREPWQMVYTLSLALPHLDSPMQAKVRGYLKEEIAARPPWDENLLGPEGTLRQPPDLPRSIFVQQCPPAKTRTPFFAYALWLYAENTGDLKAIRANWKTIKDSFKRKLGKRPTLETLSGAIGMYRLARKLNDRGTADEAQSLALEAIEYCQDFPKVVANATRAYTGQDRWRRGTHGVLYAFFNLTPGAARVLTSSPKLRAAAETYATAGRKDYPLWWMAQAPVGDSGYYGECCCSGPEQRGMLFNYEAWVAGTPATKLAYYTDVPDALLGDCTYLQNLVTAIETFGEATWVDLTK